MNQGSRRILESAEARMTASTGPAMSNETAAFFARMGITANTTEPERCRIIGGILDGKYPETMTPDDIAEMLAIVARLEAEC